MLLTCCSLSPALPFHVEVGWTDLARPSKVWGLSIAWGLSFPHVTLDCFLIFFPRPEQDVFFLL